MRQRVVIALALCAEPALIIADEPTTALDVSVQAQIIAVLKKVTRIHGAAVMLITHDMGVIAEMADRVAVMYAGRIVEIGAVGDVARRPLHPYAVGLMAAIPTLEARAGRLAQIPGTMPRLSAIPRGCAFNPRCPRVFDRCAARTAAAHCGRRSGRGVLALRRGGGAGYGEGGEKPMSFAPLVEARDLKRVFDVSQPWLSRVIDREPRRLLKAVDGVDFAVDRGETLGIVGESGSGKSTLARMVVGLLRPSAGRVLVEGVDLFATGDPAARRGVRRRMQMIFQDPYASLDPRWRVGAIIDEPIFAFRLMEGGSGAGARLQAFSGSPGEPANSFASSASIRPTRANIRTNFPAGSVSGSRSRARSPRTPTSSSATSRPRRSTSRVQAQILNLLRDLQEKLGLAYLLITHNLAVVRFMATRVGVMYLGRFVEIAKSDDLFARPRHPYTRVLLDAVPDLAMSGRARTPVGGEPPNPIDPPPGCPFHPRCAFAIERCRSEVPPFRDNVACHLAHDDPNWLARPD